MTADEIDQLVRRVRGGETEHFAELIRQFEQPVWRVVAAMLQDFEHSREIHQQVFVLAYQHLDQYQLGRDFGPWIKAIARNCVRQELRRLARETNRLEGYRQRLEERWKDVLAAERDERNYLDALAGCRGELPERAAKAVALRYEQGMSFDQIAEQMATTRDAAEKLLSRVRGLLRDCIESKLAGA